MKRIDDGTPKITVHLRLSSIRPDLDIEDDSAEAAAQQDDPDMSMSVTASPQPPSNRTSIDGMDPAFANVLRSTGSRDSFGSPVFHWGTIRGGRGGTVGSRRRGGVGYQEARPSSIVGTADVLAAEFGIGMDSVVEDHEETREFAEFACQTDPIEQPPPPPPTTIMPETTDTAGKEYPISSSAVPRQNTGLFLRFRDLCTYMVAKKIFTAFWAFLEGGALARKTMSLDSFCNM